MSGTPRFTRRTALLFVLLAIAATARLLLQIAVMPPYAGLDEIHHVARLAFVREEGRNPTIGEPSVPRYLERSILQESGEQPAFGVIGERWPEVVASGAGTKDRAVPDAERRTYTMANYEAQHPSIYYSIAARAVTRGTDLGELRAWRLFSIPFALVTVLATAAIGWRIAGDAGILAGALLATTPTWLTLVARASNDALSVAAIAVALWITFLAPESARGWIAEGAAWGFALATKLYAWPAAAILPLVWRIQRASWRRWVVVSSLGAIGFALTVVDLATRTDNPLGLFAFDRAEASGRSAAVDVAWTEAAKIFVLTFAWTSGQHQNALTPAGLVLFSGPIFLFVAAGIVAVARRRELRPMLGVVALTVAVFGFAQIVKFLAYLRHAEGGAGVLPAGGKEGWYWYALAPVFYGVLLSLILRTFLRARAGGTIAVCLFVAWVAAFDMTVHERGLFRDYEGLTTPAVRGLLVRWGPSPALEPGGGRRMAVGPIAEWAAFFRGMHLGALLAITAIVATGFRHPSGVHES
ncbi:MAG: ArnT family glycosyltransferase [Thermoanaerobaculia bacterium]